MASPATEAEREFVRVWSQPPGVLGWLREINNVPIARRYMAAAFAFFLFGGFQALLLRIQLGTPENTFLDAETYNQIFTMHGTTMMFLFVIPFLEATANYVLPAMLGTRDLPFPRLTALSFWTYVFGGFFLYSSFLFGLAPDGGWFAYVPLTGKQYSPGLNMDYWLIGLSVAEVAGIGAASELIVAVLKFRAPGMSLRRMPIFAWAMLITAFMIIFAFTPLIVVTTLLELDRKLGTRFFDAAAGGDPLLWQHLFWVFGHPEVYIMLIPAAGMVCHIVQTFSRRPIVGHRLLIGSLIGTGVISFALWAHHMFAVGHSPFVMTLFTGASMLIAIPSGILVFSLIATIWFGRPAWKTPLLFAAGFIVLFVIGGVTGVMVAVVPFDWQAHDTHFVVAHFHYTLIGGVLFPFFGALYYWLPKITGRMLSERLGKWNFWMMFAGINVTFFPMHLTGLLGMPRRIYTYQTGLGWDIPNLISSVGAFVLGAGVLLLVINFLWSLKRGESAGDNPWSADTLEWALSSPPPDYQFWAIPVVRGRHPLWQQESLAPDDPTTKREIQPLDGGPARWRSALGVTVMDGGPEAVIWIPSPTVWPLMLAIGFTFLFAGTLIDSVLLIAAGAVVTAVSVAGWFWPQKEQSLAMREMRAIAARGGLPLGISGRESAGWWGMMVFLLVLGASLASLVASYFYLASGWTKPPPMESTELILAIAAGLVLLPSAAAAHWSIQQGTPANPVRRRAGLTLSFLLGVVFFLMLMLAYRYHETRFTLRTDAHGSLFFALLGFQMCVVLGGLILFAVAQLWAWRRPDDERGYAVARIAAPYWYFVIASWIIVFATLYLSPRL